MVRTVPSLDEVVLRVDRDLEQLTDQFLRHTRVPKRREQRLFVGAGCADRGRRRPRPSPRPCPRRPASPARRSWCSRRCRAGGCHRALGGRPGRRRGAPLPCRSRHAASTVSPTDTSKLADGVAAERDLPEVGRSPSLDDGRDAVADDHRRIRRARRCGHRPRPARPRRPSPTACTPACDSANRRHLGGDREVAAAVPRRRRPSSRRTGRGEVSSLSRLALKVRAATITPDPEHHRGQRGRDRDRGAARDPALECQAGTHTHRPPWGDRATDRDRATRWRCADEPDRAPRRGRRVRPPTPRGRAPSQARQPRERSRSPRPLHQARRFGRGLSGRSGSP